MASDRPNMAYVVHSLHAGGTEKLVVEMSLAFVADYEVTVFCLDEPGIWAGKLRERGINVVPLWRQPGLDLSLPATLARYFRRNNTKIIHAHQYTPWFYAALSRLIYPVPRLLFEEHGRFFPEVKNRKRGFVNRWLIRRLTHRFVAVSQDIRRRLVDYEGLDAGQITVIYNGVTPEAKLSDPARSALRVELGLPPGAFVVGTVGRFDPIKNLPMLVESLAAAGAQAPELSAMVVGDGPVFKEIAELALACGLNTRFLMTGYRADAGRLIQCMDLFVLSSWSEGTSMALLEAIAAGVPVVVTDVGGNPEIVVDRESGWIIASGSARELTGVILEAIKCPHARLQYARAGEERFRAQFTHNRMIDKYRTVYREMLLAPGTA